jgi:uncharacterized protein (TIGR00730 family)
MSTMTAKIIAVYGSARSPEGAAAYRQAYDLGHQLAVAGFAVATGGYQGTMEAVSRGAAEAGGHVIGVTCDLFDPRPANRWLSEERRAADLHVRLQTITSLADGFIALGGGIGTLSEVALTWSLLQTEQLSRRPFILLGETWRGVVDAIARHTEIGSSVLALAQLVNSVEETTALVAEWFAEGATSEGVAAADRNARPAPTEQLSPVPIRPPA